MDFSIFDVIDNNSSNSEIIEKIKQILKEKYKINFEVKMIGNRYGTANDDSVTTYCFPVGNEKLIFTAILNKEESLVYDDYFIRKMCFELEDFVCQKFIENKINVLVKTDIVGLNYLSEDISVKDFIEKDSYASFLTYIVSETEVFEEQIKDVLNNIENKYKKIYFKTYLHSVKNFEQYKEFALSVPNVNSTIISKFNVLTENIYKLKEGNIEKII